MNKFGYSYSLSLILVISNVFSGIIAEQQNSPKESKVVKLPQGAIRGYKNAEWGTIDFFGIPYATTPTGPNKFKAPLPAPVWSDTLDAVDKKVACPQYVLKDGPFAQMFADINIVEDDCLIANIIIPDTEETNLSILVYIHGGGYHMGYGNMVRHGGLVKDGNLIVVNINYRLGVHGFLCLGTEDVPGNAGMKDQVAALRWIKKNIIHFGGNPDDITIAGGSAGAAAVDLLALSETTEGLFKRVIPESGAALGVWGIEQDALKNAESFAKLYGFKNGDVNSLEEFYKTTPLAVFNQNSTFVLGKDSSLFHVPCVERDTGTERFLKEEPAIVYINGKLKKLPYLVGFAKMEGIMNLNYFEQFKDSMNENFSEFLPGDLTFETAKQKEDVAKKVKEFYFGNDLVSKDTMQAYIDFFGDVMFNYPTMRSVKGQVEAGNYEVYLYQYSFVDDVLQEYNPYKYRGATHASQSTAIADDFVPDYDQSMESKDYKQVRAFMKKLWINFIKTGKPVHDSNETFPDGWPATSADGSPYMELDMPPKLKGTLLKERTELWNGIYERFYSIPKPPPTPPAKHTEL